MRSSWRAAWLWGSLAPPGRSASQVLGLRGSKMMLCSKVILIHETLTKAGGFYPCALSSYNMGALTPWGKLTWGSSTWGSSPILRRLSRPLPKLGNSSFVFTTSPVTKLGAPEAPAAEVQERPKSTLQPRRPRGRCPVEVTHWTSHVLVGLAFSVPEILWGSFWVPIPDTTCGLEYLPTVGWL